MRVTAIAKTTNDGGTAVFYIKDGDLYRSDTGKKTGATGVAQVFTDGTGSVYAVTKSGDLVDSGGGVVASGLSSSNTRVAAIAKTTNDGGTAVFYIKEGDLYRSDTGKKTGATNVAQVFTDGTGSVYAVTKSGDLVDSGGSVVDSGLDSSNTRVAANAKTTNDGGTAIFYVKDGNIYRSDTKKKTGATNVSQVFTDGTGSVYAVTKSGDLVNSGGSVAGSGLKAGNPRVAAIAPTSNDGDTAVYYIKEATC
ncbi:MAG: hypothetical protein FJW64_10720 [Actinobacteria bacterium]|nr:hypothetical protein [Actinomycetota bacterium]